MISWFRVQRESYNLDLASLPRISSVDINSGPGKLPLSSPRFVYSPFFGAIRNPLLFDEMTLKRTLESACYHSQKLPEYSPSVGSNSSNSSVMECSLCPAAIARGGIASIWHHFQIHQSTNVDLR